MAAAWGNAWGHSWGNAWGQVSATEPGPPPLPTRGGRWPARKTVPLPRWLAGRAVWTITTNGALSGIAALEGEAAWDVTAHGILSGQGALAAQTHILTRLAAQGAALAENDEMLCLLLGA